MLRVAIVMLFVLGAFTPPAAAEPRPRPSPASGADSPFRVAALDSSRRFDANRLDLRTSNFGWLAVDPTFSGGGLEFPRGSGQHAVFASGLWVGGWVTGQLRVTVAEYSSEWRPGRLLGGTPEPVASPDVRSWKVRPAGAWRVPGDSARVDRTGPGDALAHESWSTYVARSPFSGAPTRTVLLPGAAAGGLVPVEGPDLPGELALWSTFNDADRSAHTNPAGRTTPLGLEIRQSVFGFDTTPGNVAYVRWQVVHRGADRLDEAYVSFWVDPDLGSGRDDLVGWDPALQMGYAYNATSSDAVYGDRPPAVGVRFLSGPAGTQAGAFSAYYGGSDPDSAEQTYDLMRGRRVDRTPWIDPGTMQVTAFPFSGDPVSGTGWLDTNPGDRRFLVSAGPFSLVPGDSAEFLFAVVVGQNRDRLASIQALRCQARLARDAAIAGFVTLSPARLVTTAATSTAGGVRIAWHAEGADPRPLDVARHAGPAVDPWPSVFETRALLTPDGMGNIVHDDAALATGEVWTYGLFERCDPLRPLAQVTLQGPAPGLALRVESPFRSGAVQLHLAVPFSGPARLEAFSIDGRRVLDRELQLNQGSYVLPVTGLGPLTSGLYVFRLTRGGVSRAARAVALR